MPIKLMIKLCWIACGLVGLLVCLSVSLVFFSSPSLPAEEIDISPPDVKKKEIAHSMHYYSDIWSSQILTHAPKKVGPKAPPVDWQERLLKRHITIKSIPSNNFAVVSLRGRSRDVYLEPLLTTGKIKPQEIINRGQKKLPWEIEVSGHTAIVVQIIQGKGIEFRFKSSQRKIWLHYKDANFKPGRKNKGSDKSAQRTVTRRLGPNQWLFSAHEGEDLLRNADQHIEEMAPVVEYDSRRRPVGVKIRRVLANSKAFRYGLRANDVITGINSSRVNSLDPRFIKRLIGRHQRQRKIVVSLKRNGRRVRITFNVRR